jgi:hypothetical protein
VGASSVSLAFPADIAGLWPAVTPPEGRRMMPSTIGATADDEIR